MNNLTFGAEWRASLKITMSLRELILEEQLLSLFVNTFGGNFSIIFSTDDFKFAELPQPRKEFAEHVKTSNDFFTGQQEKILVKTQNEAPKIIRGPDGQEMIVKQKNFT